MDDGSDGSGVRGSRRARTTEPPMSPSPSSPIRMPASIAAGPPTRCSAVLPSRPERANVVRGVLRPPGTEDSLTADTRPIRVLLVDDHQLLTDSLARLLAAEPDIEVVGVGGSVADAKLLARERMDVVLMDYRLPDGTGAEATRAIKARWPTARVVMLTAVKDDETVLESIQAGADGYLTKDRAVDDVVATVRSARAGETLLPRSVIIGIAQRVASARDRQPERPPDRDPHGARAPGPAIARRGTRDPRHLRTAVHLEEHASDARAEHHDEAARALEARGRDRRPAQPDHRSAASGRPPLLSRAAARRRPSPRVGGAAPEPRGARRPAVPPRRAGPGRRAD